MKNTAVLLAAGGGTRMGTRKPKTLLKLNGKPIVSYGVSALSQLNKDGLNEDELKNQDGFQIGELIAVVHVKPKRVSMAIKKAVGKSKNKTTNDGDPGLKVRFAHQKELLGTADAVKTALEVLSGGAGDNGEPSDDTCILVLPADAPLITSETLRQLLEQHHKSQNPATLLTAKVSNPEGYGRVIRDDKGNLKKIVEHIDASQAELLVNEICTSIYCFRLEELTSALAEIQPAKISEEYYLTDVVRILVEAGEAVGAFIAPDPNEILGVNTREQFQKVSQLQNRGDK